MGKRYIFRRGREGGREGRRKKEKEKGRTKKCFLTASYILITTAPATSPVESLKMKWFRFFFVWMSCFRCRSKGGKKKELTREKTH